MHTSPDSLANTFMIQRRSTVEALHAMYYMCTMFLSLDTYTLCYNLYFWSQSILMLEFLLHSPSLMNCLNLSTLTSLQILLRRLLDSFLELQDLVVWTHMLSPIGCCNLKIPANNFTKQWLTLCIGKWMISSHGWLIKHSCQAILSCSTRCLESAQWGLVILGGIYLPNLFFLCVEKMPKRPAVLTNSVLV